MDGQSRVRPRAGAILIALLICRIHWRRLTSPCRHKTDECNDDDGSILLGPFIVLSLAQPCLALDWSHNQRVMKRFNTNQRVCIVVGQRQSQMSFSSSQMIQRTDSSIRSSHCGGCCCAGGPFGGKRERFSLVASFTF